MRAQAATSAPLIERSIERATGIVYNITGGKDLTLQEARDVSIHLQFSHPPAHEGACFPVAMCHVGCLQRGCGRHAAPAELPLIVGVT